MSGTSAVNPVDVRAGAARLGQPAQQPLGDVSRQALASQAEVDIIAPGASLPAQRHTGLSLRAPVIVAAASAAARLAQTQDATDVAGFRAVLGRFNALSRGDASGYSAATMAAAGVRDGGEFATYLQGQRVQAPEAAILSAAGTPRNTDIGTALQDYRVFLRYEVLSPTGAAVLATTRTTTGADYEAVYQHYRRSLFNAGPEAAGLALASAELETGRYDVDSPTSTATLRQAGFEARDAGIISAMVLRHGQGDLDPTALAVGLRLEDVPDRQRGPLVAIGVASRRTPVELADAYRWFASNGAGSPESATMLTAGWAMEGRGDARGLVTALAARTTAWHL